MSEVASFRCPYCGSQVPQIWETSRKSHLSFKGIGSNYSHSVSNPDYHDDYAYMLNFHRCPQCKNITVFAVGFGSKVAGKYIPLSPNSNARQFPEYIPQAIRSDYEEACAIVNLSPKASATLSRRCLQGMIRDYWGINENNLFQSIQALQNKVPAAQWAAIDALRKLGNIGAHMESDVNLIVDIDVGEAEKLIKLIELLLAKWYISRHDEDELLKTITQINEEKQEQRHS